MTDRRKFILLVIFHILWLLQLTRATLFTRIENNDEYNKDNMILATRYTKYTRKPINSNLIKSNVTESEKPQTKSSLSYRTGIQEKVINMPKTEIINILALMNTLKELDNNGRNNVTNTDNISISFESEKIDTRFDYSSNNSSRKNDVPIDYINKLSFLRKTFLEELNRRKHYVSNSTLLPNISNEARKNNSEVQKTLLRESNNRNTTRTREIPILDPRLANIFLQAKKDEENDLFR